MPHLKTFEKKCPCEDCISMAICRHKHYMDLFDDCILLRDHIRLHDIATHRSGRKVYELQRILKPTIWVFKFDKEYHRTFPLVFSLNEQGEIISPSIGTIDDEEIEYEQ